MQKCINDKLVEIALLISADVEREIILEYYPGSSAHAGHLAYGTARTMNRDARNNHLALPSGTRPLADQTNVIWKIAYHDASISPLRHRPSPAHSLLARAVPRSAL